MFLKLYNNLCYYLDLSLSLFFFSLHVCNFLTFSYLHVNIIFSSYYCAVNTYLRLWMNQTLLQWTLASISTLCYPLFLVSPILSIIELCPRRSWPVWTSCYWNDWCCTSLSLSFSLSLATSHLVFLLCVFTYLFIVLHVHLSLSLSHTHTHTY